MRPRLVGREISFPLGTSDSIIQISESRKLVLHSERGVGDAILFSYFPTLEMQPESHPCDKMSQSHTHAGECICEPVKPGMTRTPVHFLVSIVWSSDPRCSGSVVTEVPPEFCARWDFYSRPLTVSWRELPMR